MSIKCAVQVAKKLGFLGCEGVFGEETERRKADVEVVEEGRVVSGRGGEDVACTGGGGEAVVAGEEEGGDGGGGRGEGGTVQEGRGDGVGW